MKSDLLNYNSLIPALIRSAFIPRFSSIRKSVEEYSPYLTAVFSVCEECPLKLLERLMDANNTLDAGKANALMADFTDKMDKIADRAQAVNVSH